MNKNKYLYYKGVYYDVGTKVKLKTRWGDIKTTTFLGYRDFEGVSQYSIYTNRPSEDYIIEIVEPVYYQEPEPQQHKKANVFMRTGSGSWNSDDDVFHAFLLYLAVMLGGIIFKDRWLIWIMATIVYFSWLKKK